MRIKLKQVSKKYGKENVFFIKDYQFEENKIHGIVGDNGSGKTTLLRILSGLDRVYDGEIQYDDKPYQEDLIKDMTYISQKSYMLSCSVFENIAYPLKIRKYSKETIQRKVEEFLKRFKLEHLKNRSARVLSSGEQQKVALARALIFEPKLLFLDEPTANIDPDTVEFLENILLDFRKTSKSNIIIVTHNMDQAFRLCHQVAQMKDGKLEQLNKKEL